jgi:membrane-bound lytic murein transglycosylase
MNENTRYIFFAIQPDDDRDPAGAAGVSLPPGRAVAIDPAHHAYGALLWLDARAPVLSGAFPVYRRLVTALDTGSAIRGPRSRGPLSGPRPGGGRGGRPHPPRPTHVAHRSQGLR